MALRYLRFPANSLRGYELRRQRSVRVAGYHDYVRFSTPGGIVRVPLNSPKVIGVVNSRGERE